MKKLILILIVFTACEEPGNVHRHTDIDIGEYDTAIIDSCEYIVDYYDRSRSITHKGNCKNCNKKNNQ